MLNTKTYACGICKTVPDQISHHKSHIETQKHKDKRELFEFKLSKLNDVELEKTYKTTNIHDIIMETETILYISNNKTNLLNDKKKLKQTILNNLNDITEEQMSDTQKDLKQKTALLNNDKDNFISNILLDIKNIKSLLKKIK